MPELRVIGRSEAVAFPELKIDNIPARVDTGAKTSAIWASGIIETDGTLQCVLFGPDSEYYTGQVLYFTDYSTKSVASSIGMVEERYVVKLLVGIGGKLVRASFTLANRSVQAYPMLIGRNILRGKFIVDVKHGLPLKQLEQQRSEQLQATPNQRKGNV